MIRAFVVSLCLSIPAIAGPHVFHRGNDGEPTTLDPQKFQLSLENVVMSELFDGLTTTTADGRVIPGLAESWTLSPDGKIYTFTLRPNLKWSDGKPILAEDAAFALRRAVDPKLASSFASFLNIIENGPDVIRGAKPPSALGVKALDARRLEVRMTRPAPTLLLLLAGWPFTYPVPQHVVEKDPKWSRVGTLVGSGPFTLAEWRPNDRVRVVKNPLFYDAAKVKLDEIVFYPTQDESAALMRFRAKELDFNPRLPSAQIEWLRKNLAKETFVGPAMQMSYLTINLRRKPFDDVRVRRALALAIDRAAITDKVLRAGQTPSCGFVPAVIRDYKPQCKLDLRPIPERQAEARALLAQAGYGPAKPLSLTYSSVSGANARLVSVALQSMWAQIGVKADILQTDTGVHFSRLQQGDFDVALAGWSANSDPEFFTYLIKSTSTESNYGPYKNPAYDAAVNKAEIIVDREPRFAAFAAAEAIALKDQPIIPLWIPVNGLIKQQWVQGVVPNPEGGYPSRFISVNRPGATAP